MDMSPASTAQTTLRAITAKYEVFDPADRSEGLSVRLFKLLRQMERARELIDEALSYTPGTHSFDQLLDMVLQGHLAFWSLPKSFMLTEISIFPGARHFHIFLGGGDLQELIAVHPDVLAVAKVLGCSKVTIAGRPGWGRAMKAHGWHTQLVTIAKDV